MKKIIINNLTKEELSEIMYGDDSNLETFTIKEINQIFKLDAKKLQEMYEAIDEERYEDISIETLYILGDIINMLNNTKFINNK